MVTQEVICVFEEVARVWLENGFVASKSEMPLGQIVYDDKNILHVFIIPDNNLCQIF